MALDISGMINTLVSITQFNKGQASPLFSRAQKGETLLVIKNNAPIAVILSPEEYEILRALPKMCDKMIASSQEGCLTEISTLLDKLHQHDKNGERYV